MSFLIIKRPVTTEQLVNIVQCNGCQARIDLPLFDASNTWSCLSLPEPKMPLHFCPACTEKLTWPGRNGA